MRHRKNGRTTPAAIRRSLRRSTRCTSIAAIIALAAFTSLLCPRADSASLLQQLPATHWSHDAFARLEAHGLAEEGRVEERHEAARRLIRTLTRIGLLLGDTAAFEALPGPQAARVTSTAFSEPAPGLNQLPAWEDVLAAYVGVKYRTAKMGDALQAHRAGGRNPSIRRALDNAAGEMNALDGLLHDLDRRLAPFLERDPELVRSQEALFDRNALREALDAISSLHRKLNQIESRLLDALPSSAGREFVGAARPALEGAIGRWLRSRAQAPEGVTAEVLAGDLRKLESEFAFELKALGNRFFISEWEGGGSLLALTGMARTDVPASPSARVAFPLEGQGPSGSLFAAGRLPAPQWSDPASGVERESWKAEYGTRILGLDVRTRLEFSPNPQETKDRPPVDVDRIRSALQREEPGDEASDQEFSVAGEIRVGDSTSVKIGYELGRFEELGLAELASGTLAAGLEHALGERAEVRAGYFRDAGERGVRMGADLGVGYRFSDHASLRASYSLVRLGGLARDEGAGILLDSLGEAKFEVRF